MTDVDLVAALMNEDVNVRAPDEEDLLFEWWWSKNLDAKFTDPVDKALASLLNKDQLKRMAQASGRSVEDVMATALHDARFELKKFIQHYNPHGNDQEVLKAFVDYKRHGRLSSRGKDVGELDKRGGDDFGRPQRKYTGYDW